MSTRAASRMEEQMGALLEKMDQQSQQLQLLTRQQSEQLDQIAQKQKETNEHVSAVAEDLESVKTNVHGRLSAVEERQGVLKQELREELLQELSASLSIGTGPGLLRPTAPTFVPSDATAGVAGRGDTAVSPGEEGATPEPRTVSGGRRAAAAESRATLVGGGDGEATSGGGPTFAIAGIGRGGPGDSTGVITTTPTSLQQRPAPFDGKTAWDAYCTQFELLAQINRWSESDKAAHLAISLRGPAATVLTNLPPDQRQSYRALTTALDSRFGTTHQTELNRMRLKARARRREESLAKLAEDVERLVRLAYPEAAESMVEVLAKDQFVDALPEEDMRLRIRQHKPATLRDAPRSALELESYQLASKQKARFVREAQLEEGHPAQWQASGYRVKQSSVDETGQPSRDVLQQLVEALQHCVKRSGRPQRALSSRKERNQSGGSNLICWECKEKGHRRRECPKLLTGTLTRQQAERELSRQGNGKQSSLRGEARL